LLAALAAGGGRDRTREPAPGLTKRLWEPGWRDGVGVEISHVPKDHPVGKTYGVGGNILVAQAIGGF
jgi:hypothetical protein